MNLRSKALLALAQNLVVFACFAAAYVGAWFVAVLYAAFADEGQFERCKCGGRVMELLRAPGKVLLPRNDTGVTLRCAHCGKVGPGGSDVLIAARLSMNAGWAHTEHGEPSRTLVLCPRCAPEFFQAQNQSHP